MKLLEKITFQDVDEWYEEQKDLLDETMFNNLQKGNEYEKEKILYDKNFEKLQKEFNKKILQAETHNELAKKLLNPIQRFNNWKKKKKLKIKNWWTLKTKERKDKKFKKEYKKLFHIKEKKFEISKRVLAKKNKK